MLRYTSSEAFLTRTPTAVTYVHTGVGVANLPTNVCVICPRKTLFGHARRTVQAVRSAPGQEHEKRSCVAPAGTTPYSERRRRDWIYLCVHRRCTGVVYYFLFAVQSSPKTRLDEPSFNRLSYSTYIRTAAAQDHTRPCFVQQTENSPLASKIYVGERVSIAELLINTTAFPKSRCEWCFDFSLPVYFLFVRSSVPFSFVCVRTGRSTRKAT